MVILLPESEIFEMYIRHWAGGIGLVILTSFLLAWLRVLWVPSKFVPGDQPPQ